MGKVGVLTARVEEFNGEEFLRRFPINEIACPRLNLLAQSTLEALHSCETNLQFALENFIVSLEAFQAMFEVCISHVRCPFCGKMSDLFVNHSCESLSTFQIVPTILSRLTKVEEEVSAWAKWKGDNTIAPDETVEVSHAPSSCSEYHGSMGQHEIKEAPQWRGVGGQGHRCLILWLVLSCLPINCRLKSRIHNFCTFTRSLKLWPPVRWNYFDTNPLRTSG